MKRLSHAALTLCAMVPFAVTSAYASSHREAPAIANDPVADNTDVYAWVEPGTRDKLYLIANYIPLEEPSGGPNFHGFSDQVRYEIHVTKGTSLQDHVVYRIDFQTAALPEGDPADPFANPIGNGLNFFSQIAGIVQTATITKIRGNNTQVLASAVPVAPVNIGPRTDAVAYGNPDGYSDAFAAGFIRNMSNGGRVFLGPRDDGFYVDLGGVFDLANLRGADTDGDQDPTEDAQDGVSGFNTHTIALEIPIQDIFGIGVNPVAGSPDDVLGVWASAARRKITVLKNNGQKEFCGPFVQVSRLGLPLVNEVLIGLQDKDRFNASRPHQDLNRFAGYFLNPVIVRDAEAVGIYAALGVPQETIDVLKQNRGDIVSAITLGLEDDGVAIGDVLRVDAAVDSSFPNGRSLQQLPSPDQENSDVTDVLMTVILAGGALPLEDGVRRNDKPFLTEFPFLPAPHQGRTEGHGSIPAP